MARRKKNNKALAVVENSYDLAQVELSEADKALLSEIAINRKAIVKLGQIALDHERRLQSLEEAVGELAGEELEPIDVKAEKEDEEQDED